MKVTVMCIFDQFYIKSGALNKKSVSVYCKPFVRSCLKSTLLVTHLLNIMLPLTVRKNEGLRATFSYAGMSH